MRISRSQREIVMDAKEVAQAMNRRHFLQGSSTGLGTLALNSLVSSPLKAASSSSVSPTDQYVRESHFAPKAKRVIYLFQSGAPSQFETLDYKPKLRELRG